MHQHFLLGHSRWFMLFEFGHFDDDTGYVYWQRAKVKFQDNIVFVNTADIKCDKKIYEQKELGKISNIGIIRKATLNEQIIFEENVDEYLTKMWFNGVLDKNDVTIGSYPDGRMSMLKLVADPPVYTYLRVIGASPEDVFIFKTAPLCYDNNGKFIINAKEMLLINDEVRIIEPDETMMVCCYSEVSALREATDSERKLLLIKADDKKKSLKDSSKIGFANLFLLEWGTILFASTCIKHYIFPYKGYTKDEEKANLHYDNCLLLNGNDKFFITSEEYVKEIDYNSLKVLRYANDNEIHLYNEQKYAATMKPVVLNNFELTFRPFSTKVLVSDGQGDIWRPAIFGCIVDDDVQRYMIVGGQKFKYCMPYKQFKNLLGKKFEKFPDDFK